MTTFNSESEMSRLTSVVKIGKEEAKDLRDDGDIPSAIQALKDAITAIDQSPLSDQLLETDAPSGPQKKLAFHLADCLGMLGGNHRRLNRFAEALDAFTRGRTIEESEKLEVPSSYNLVNAITLPLEIAPQTFSQQEVPLRRAIAAIQRQVKLEERRKDRWAWADLGECQLLLGDLEGAKASYKRMRELGNADTVISVVTVLRRLQNALDSASKLSAALNQGIEWLQSSIRL